MSLNPELFEVAGAGNHTTRPVPYAGEVLLASRSSCRLALDDRARTRAAGTMYVTNYRLVFVASKPTRAFRSIELPLLHIGDFDVVQPIFGANYLHGVCEPTADGRAAGLTGRITWRVSFMAGGMSTMVPLFYRTVAYVRAVASSRDAGVREPSGEGEAAKPGKVPEFLATAVVDPNDPTVVYVVSEQDEDCRTGGDHGGDGGDGDHGGNGDHGGDGGNGVRFETAW